MLRFNALGRFWIVVISFSVLAFVATRTKATIIYDPQEEAPNYTCKQLAGRCPGCHNKRYEAHPLPMWEKCKNTTEAKYCSSAGTQSVPVTIYAYEFDNCGGSYTVISGTCSGSLGNGQACNY